MYVVLGCVRVVPREVTSFLTSVESRCSLRWRRYKVNQAEVPGAYEAFQGINDRNMPDTIDHKLLARKP